MHLKTFKGHTAPIKSIAITPDSQTIVSASEDETIKLWNIKTGEYLQTLKGHTDSVNSIAITPDGQSIVSGSDDKTIKLWNIKTGECLQTLNDLRVKLIAITPDGRFIVTSGSGFWNYNIRIWNINTGECIKTLGGHLNFVESIAISPNGQKIVSGSLDYTIKIWNINTGKCIKTLKGHYWEVTSIAITPDNQFIVSGSDNCIIKIWNINTGECIKTLKGHEHSIYGNIERSWSRIEPYPVAITPDGNSIVEGSFILDVIKVWNRHTGKCVKTIREPDGLALWMNSIAITPDSQCIVSGHTDNTVKVWKLN
jgi:WD40 repeat protein